MASDLGSSLTSIDWLPRLTLQGPQGGGPGRLGSPRGRGGRVKEGKPPHSYTRLISLAISSVPGRRMTLSEIYRWITDTFPYYQGVGAGWKNSIRHNLSLNKCFRKIPRSKDNPGKGSYWTVDRNVKEDPPSPQGVKRPHAPNEDSHSSTDCDPEHSISSGTCQSISSERLSPFVGDQSGYGNTYDQLGACPSPQGKPPDQTLDLPGVPCYTELAPYVGQTEHRKIPSMVLPSRQDQAAGGQTDAGQVSSYTQCPAVEGGFPRTGGAETHLTPMDGVFSFPELDFEDLNMSFRSLCRSIREQSSGLGTSSADRQTPLHTPSDPCSPLPSSSIVHPPHTSYPFADPSSPSLSALPLPHAQHPRSLQLARCTTRTNSQGTEAHDQRQESARTPIAGSGPALSPDWYTSTDSVKAGFQIASTLDWTEVDLTQFPGLVENLQPVNSDPRSLNHAQFKDLCSSLNHIFQQNGLIRAQAPPRIGNVGRKITADNSNYQPLLIQTGQLGSPDSGAGPYPQASAFLTSLVTALVPPPGPRVLPTQRMYSTGSDIQDEFDWDSIA